MDQKYIVALELSGTQVKGALATVTPNALSDLAIPTVEAIVSEDNADCVQYGRVQNLINAAKCTSSVIQKLSHLPAIADCEICAAYVGLSGRSLASEQATATIELPSEQVITHEILKSLFIEASKMASPNKKVLRVLPRKYVVDSQTMLNPVGALGQRLRGDFTIVTCNPVNQRNLDLVLRERVNLNVEKYIVTPLAIADMTLTEEEKHLGCILVDMGAQTTTISIYKERALQYLATLPIGAHNITRDISQGLNMTIERAEAAKKEVGDAMAHTAKTPDETSKINSYVTARAYELVVNIMANLGYAGYDVKSLPAGFVLTGRGAKLHNFDSLLSNQSKLRVRFASVPSGIDFAPGTDVAPTDYISLLSVVLRVCQSHNFTNCAKQKETIAVEEPQPQPQPEPVRPVAQQPLAQVQPAEQPAEQRANWALDDPAPNADTTEADTQPKPKKNRRSFLDKIKNGLDRIMRSDGLDDDAQI